MTKTRQRSITANKLISSKPFDPYPFILLNLILSCLASIQADFLEDIIKMLKNNEETR